MLGDPCRPHVLSDLFILPGVSAHIRSDNGPEFVAKAVQEWIAVAGAKNAYIERGSPWENGYIESFNATVRLECLGRQWFLDLDDAREKIEGWRAEYNEVRPHSAIGDRTPVSLIHLPPQNVQASTQP